MAKQKSKDLRDLGKQELVDKLDIEQKDFMKFRFMHAVSPLENPLLLRMSRRNIAKMKTEIRRRELQEKQTGK